MDGNISNRRFPLEITDGWSRLLVDDANRNVLRTLDSFSDQLVAHQGRNQRTLCIATYPPESM